MWLFWERGWQFKNWYVNLEEPRRRWAGGIDSEDHFLDICVYPDRHWEWRDEDEFAQAQRDGLMTDARAAEVQVGGAGRDRTDHGLGRAVRRRLGGLAARSGLDGAAAAGRLGPRTGTFAVVRERSDIDATEGGEPWKAAPMGKAVSRGARSGAEPPCCAPGLQT